MPPTPRPAPASLGDSIIDDLTGGGVETDHFGCFIVCFCVDLWGDGVDTCTITCVDDSYGATTLPAHPYIDNGIGRRLIDGEGRRICRNWLCFCSFCCILSISAHRTRIALTSAVVGLLIYLLTPITHIYLPIAYFTQETTRTFKSSNNQLIKELLIEKRITCMRSHGRGEADWVRETQYC